MYVWHYAPWIRLRNIVCSGVLKPSNAGAPAEAPVLWFSADPVCEPTALKAVRTQSGVRLLSFAEHEERFGLTRFGLPVNDLRLLPWESACKLAGIARLEQERLERSGRALGADPANWFGCLSPVRLQDLHFQVWLRDSWHPAECSIGMAAAWEESQLPDRDPRYVRSRPG